MPCYHPMLAWRIRTGPNGSGTWPITFSHNNADLSKEVILPCGKCIGCRLERSRQWATRAIYEASMYEKNCFLTLTYNDENRPVNNSINKREMQLFLKRLRKKYGEGIKHFLCGEYGEKNDRPHYHVCLFNHDFDDKQIWEGEYFAKNPFSTADAHILYRSPSLEKLWPFGYSTIGTLTFESAAYVARYVTKKISGNKAKLYYGNRTPEFCLSSRNPALGKRWFEEYKNDVLSTDRVIIRKDLQVRPPRYYDYLVQNDNPDEMAKIRERRKETIDETKCTAHRLLTREEIQILRNKRLKRSLENAEHLLNP